MEHRLKRFFGSNVDAFPRHSERSSKVLGFSLQMPAFELSSSSLGDEEVDDGPPQIRLEELARTDVTECPGQANERLLRQVFSLFSIPGQQIAEPDGDRQVSDVEISE